MGSSLVLVSTCPGEVNNQSTGMVVLGPPGNPHGVHPNAIIHSNSTTPLGMIALRSVCRRVLTETERERERERERQHTAELPPRGRGVSSQINLEMENGNSQEATGDNQVIPKYKLANS